MTPDLPDHLDLDLPPGRVLALPHDPLSPESLAAWRLRRYQLALEIDPRLPHRWVPKTVPFELD